MQFETNSNRKWKLSDARTLTNNGDSELQKPWKKPLHNVQTAIPCTSLVFNGLLNSEFWSYAQDGLKVQRTSRFFRSHTRLVHSLRQQIKCRQFQLITFRLSYSSIYTWSSLLWKCITLAFSQISCMLPKLCCDQISLLWLFDRVWSKAGSPLTC